MDTPPPSEDAFLAAMVDDAVSATTPPRETPPERRTRAAMIADMLHAFTPANAMEAMIACQCVMLRYALLGAMRALCGAEDEKARARLQSAMNGLSRTAHQWHTLYQTTQARRLSAEKARATAAAEAREALPAKARPEPRTAAKPVPPTPDRSDNPPPLAPLPSPGFPALSEDMAASAAALAQALSGPGRAAEKTAEARAT